MSSENLMERVARAGVELWLQDGNLHYRGPERALSESLRAELAASKHDVIRLLVCDPALGTRGRHARLCALLDEAVNTRQGKGRLWQVFGGRVGVVIRDRVVFMNPWDVILDE